MRQRLFILSLLPLLLLFSIVTVPCLGQTDTNPFGDDSDTNPFGNPTKKAGLKKIPTAKDRLNELKNQVHALQQTVDEFRKRNEELISHVGKMEDAEAELKRQAEESAKLPEELHQELFDSLLFSDANAQQELALKHMVGCIEKSRAKNHHVSIYSVEVNQRLKFLTESEVETVKEMAAACLWTLNPDDALEIGFQFGARWKPLEHVKTDMNTRRIHDALARPFDLLYDETPLWEILDELKRDIRTEIRLSEGIDEEQEVSYESSGRTLLNSLSGLLESKKLGFTIKDEEIVIVKNTSSELESVATYNVSGLDSMAQIKREEVIKLLEEVHADDGVKFSTVGKHLFTAKTDLKTHRKIQETIAGLVPPPKWISR